MEQNMNSLYTESTKSIIYNGYEEDEDTILWRNDLILDNLFFLLVALKIFEAQIWFSL